MARRDIDAEKLAQKVLELEDKLTPRKTFEAEIQYRFLLNVVTPMIASAPTEDVAPVVHAHWVGLNGTFVPIDEYGAPIESAFCSHCNKMLVGSDEYFAIGQYCPNCGAKMDEEEPNERDSTN